MDSQGKYKRQLIYVKWKFTENENILNNANIVDRREECGNFFLSDITGQLTKGQAWF